MPLSFFRSKKVISPAAPTAAASSTSSTPSNSEWTPRGIPNPEGESSRPRSTGRPAAHSHTESEVAPEDILVGDPALIGNSGITFAEILLCEPLQRALAEKNYIAPSPIQAQAIPHLLQGRDLIGLAQTGTGKTAAFALPILNKLASDNKPAGPKRFRALILTPTRELAIQIAASFQAYGKYLRISHTLVFGGVPEGAQIRQLAKGVDIVIATPGRFLDLFERHCFSLDAVETFVLDEADRMLDMGFVHDVKRIVSRLPAKRQALLFSATMPSAITELSRTIVHDAVRVEVAPVSSTADRIDQQVAFVARDDKKKLLLHLVQQNDKGLILVFVRMKHGANRLCEYLEQQGIRAEAIHGNKSQGARQRALENFRAGRSRILIATDIAARGIDVKGVALVINYDLPEEPEGYVHRIGRTARAGADGRAIAMCDRSERPLLRSIERLTRQTIPTMKDHPFAGTAETEQSSEPENTGGFRRGGRSGGGGGGNRSSGPVRGYSRSGLPRGRG